MIYRTAAILAVLVLAGCTPIVPAAVAPSATATPLAAVATLAPTPIATAKPKPTLAPARLIFGNDITYASHVCMAYGYATIPMTVTVVNKGQKVSDYVWFKIGQLGALASGKLVDANWPDAKYNWDQSLFSDTMGYLFVRGPEVAPGKKMVLKFGVQTIDVGTAQYDVSPMTGPSTITTAADLAGTETDYTSLVTTMSFC